MKKIYSIFALAASFALTGCIEEIEPEGYITSTHTSGATTGQINASSAALEASLAGIPSAMSQGYYVYGNQTHETDMAQAAINIEQTEMLGDMIAVVAGYDWYGRFNWGCAGGGLSNTGYYSYLPWFTYYKFIKIANDVISMVDAETEEDPTKLSIVGSAYACRAFDYLMLSVLYEPMDNIYTDCSKVLGSNPPHTALTVCKVTEKTTPDEAKSNPRLSHDDMIDFIISDLDVAEKCFAVKNQTNPTVPNLAVVYGLKAKAYLWHLDYVNAAKYARMAIDEFGGTPMTQTQWLDKTSAFSVANQAWMWYVSVASEGMQNLANYIGWVSGEADWGYGSLTKPMISKSLYDKISDTDFRKGAFLDPDRSKTLAWYGGKYDNMSVRGKDFIENDAPDYMSLKFRPKNGDWESYSIGAASDIPVMRVEEMYFIEAYAKGKQNLAEGIAALSSFMSQYRNPAYFCKAADERAFELELLTQMRVEFWGEGNAFPLAKRIKPDIIQNYEGTNVPDNRYKFNTKGGTPGWTFVIPLFETQSNQVLEDQNNPDPSQTVKYPTPVGEFAPGNY